MKFYSDVMGVSVGLIGIMMMVARFVDAFTDVAMGQLVDRSKVRKAGKFKPWILWMSGPVSLASFLMYASRFSNADMGFKIVWMFFTYLLWGSVFYTSINIPYGSMASAITSDTKGRAEKMRNLSGAEFSYKFFEIWIVLYYDISYISSVGDK